MTDLSRRTALATLALGGLTACATVPPREPVVSINLADVAPPARPEGTRLDADLDQARRMTVPVWIGRKGPFPFVIDTGANRTVISIEAAEACGLERDGATPVHGIVGVQPSTLVRAPRLRFGSVVSQNLSLPTLPREAMGADGLLGVDVMRSRVVRLDFQRYAFEVDISRPGAVVGRGSGSRIPDPSRGIEVAAQYRSGQLVIFDADVAGVPVRAFLDSGAQVTCANIALRDRLLAERPDLVSRLTPTQLISATGQTSPAQMGPLPRLRLGGLGLNNINAAFAPLHIFDLWGLNDRPALLVGIDVLRNFDQVQLDFGGKTVTFTRSHRS